MLLSRCPVIRTLQNKLRINICEFSIIVKKYKQGLTVPNIYSLYGTACMVDLHFLISKFVHHDRELSHVEVVSEFLSSIRLVGLWTD